MFVGPIKKVDFCLVPWRNVSVKGTLGKSLNKLKDVVNTANFFGVLSNLRLVDVLKIIIFIADGSLRYTSHYSASKSTLSFFKLISRSLLHEMVLNICNSLFLRKYHT